MYKSKLNPDGSLNKLKVRMVVKGYAQQFGVDFNDMFAPVARYETIILLFVIVVHRGWKIYQLDVKSAFLNGDLEEEIFIEQPEGFQVTQNKKKVYLLKKALYGLKQAPRAWYSKIDEHLSKFGFLRSMNEQTLYIKEEKKEMIIISLYIDDLLITGNNCTLIGEIKGELKKVFAITDLEKNAIFSWHGNISNSKWYICVPNEIY